MDDAQDIVFTTEESLLLTAEQLIDSAMRGDTETAAMHSLRAIGYALVAIGWSLSKLRKDAETPAA